MPLVNSKNGTRLKDVVLKDVVRQRKFYARAMKRRCRCYNVNHTQSSILIDLGAINFALIGRRKSGTAVVSTILFSTSKLGVKTPFSRAVKKSILSMCCGPLRCCIAGFSAAAAQASRPQRRHDQGMG